MNRAARAAILLTAAMPLCCGGGSRAQSTSGGAPAPAARAAESGSATGAPSAAGSSSARIPLVAGLTVVTAIVMGARGDGESVKQVTAIDDEAIRLTYSADVAVQGMGALLGGSKAGDVRHVRGKRRVSRADLAGAREYMHLFGEAVPEDIPGSTALGVSAAVLDELKRGEATLTMRSGGVGASLGNLIGAFAGPEFAGVKEIRDLEDIDKVRGTLRRVEKTAVPLTVLVNGVPADLPAVHARGDIGDRDGDFYFLDDPSNPLTLKFTLGDDRLQVIKIAWPEANAAANKPDRIEADLAGRGRAEVYGIYFDFDRDVLRPESKPVLDEIAAALREHDDWRLGVEGHTDNIGSGAHNLDLSRRRASAVKKALVEQYGIAEGRLIPEGFGASRPKGTNDTVEGRALNRRVELVRQ